MHACMRALVANTWTSLLVTFHSPPCCTASQEGQYILSEGAALDASAKFYMIESGTVDCFRTFEVSLFSLYCGHL
jgi:hypothetical protein